MEAFDSLVDLILKDVQICMSYVTKKLKQKKGNAMETQNNQCVMHNNICGELNELYRKKNHDYGDSFHQEYEEDGIIVAKFHIGEKYSRFKRLIKADGEVKEESIRDTLMDLANYAILTVMELDAEKERW